MKDNVKTKENETLDEDKDREIYAILSLVSIELCYTNPSNRYK